MKKIMNLGKIKKLKKEDLHHLLLPHLHHHHLHHHLLHLLPRLTKRITKEGFKRRNLKIKINLVEKIQKEEEILIIEEEGVEEVITSLEEEAISTITDGMMEIKERIGEEKQTKVRKIKAIGRIIQKRKN